MTRRWKAEARGQEVGQPNPGPSTSAPAGGHHAGQSGSHHSQESGREHTITGSMSRWKRYSIPSGCVCGVSGR